MSSGVTMHLFSRSAPSVLSLQVSCWAHTYHCILLMTNPLLSLENLRVPSWRFLQLTTRMWQTTRKAGKLPPSESRVPKSLCYLPFFVVPVHSGQTPGGWGTKGHERAKLRTQLFSGPQEKERCINSLVLVSVLVFSYLVPGRAMTKSEECHVSQT